MMEAFTIFGTLTADNRCFRLHVRVTSHSSSLQVERLKQFSIDKVSKKMVKLALDLWYILAGLLFAASPNSNQR